MEFLRYPHLITGHFNGRVFGPPWSFTSTSAWTWVGHPVSGQIHLTLCALLRLALASAPNLKFLTLPDTFTRRTILQKVPDHPLVGLSVLVSTRFQVLFHSPPGVLFTFPSQYLFSIGHWVVFRLGGWSPRIPTGFHVSGGTLDPAGQSRFSSTRLSLPMAYLPR